MQTRAHRTRPAHLSEYEVRLPEQRSLELMDAPPVITTPPPPRPLDLCEMMGWTRPEGEEPQLMYVFPQHMATIKERFTEPVRPKSATAQMLHMWIQHNRPADLPSVGECMAAERMLQDGKTMADQAWMMFQMATGRGGRGVAFLTYLEYGKHGLTFPADGGRRSAEIIAREKDTYACSWAARREYNLMCANLGRCIRELGWGIITYPEVLHNLKGTVFRRLVPSRLEELKTLLTPAQKDELYRRSTLVEDFISE